MLDKLTSLFKPAEAQAPDPARAVRMAAAAILVAAGRSDDEYDAREKAVVQAALGRLYDLSAEAAAILEAEAGDALEAAVDHQRFTRALKDATTVKERADFLTEVWRVVLADAKRDAHEDAFMRKLAGLLQVPDRENGLARRRAESGR